MKNWALIWLKVFLHPGEDTILAITDNPTHPNIAYLWIFLSAALFALCSGFGFTSLLIAVALTVSFAASIFIKHNIAKALGGTGSYNKLALAFAAIYAPLAIIASLLALIWQLPSLKAAAYILFSFAFIYDLLLQVTAIKALNSLSWGKSAICIIVPLVGVLVILIPFFIQ